MIGLLQRVTEARVRVDSEVVGEIGCPDILGRTYTYPEARAVQAVPLGLATGGRVTQLIAKGELLTEANFQPNPELFVYRLRQMQDEQLKLEA